MIIWGVHCQGFSPTLSIYIYIYRLYYCGNKIITLEVLVHPKSCLSWRPNSKFTRPLAPKVRETELIESFSVSLRECNERKRPILVVRQVQNKTFRIKSAWVEILSLTTELHIFHVMLIITFMLHSFQRLKDSEGSKQVYSPQWTLLFKSTS